MRSAFVSFQKEVESLASFLEAAENDSEFLPAMRAKALTTKEQKQLDAILDASTVRRRFTYAITVVTLYGALERFVEQALHSYLAFLKHICKNYEDLPQEVLKTHLQLSIDYLALVRDGKVRTDDSAAVVVERLNGCLTGAVDYTFNSHAFTVRSQNVNRESASRLFRNVGIDVSFARLVATKTANDFFAANEQQRDEQLRNPFSVVDTITVARNLVAHGVAYIDQIDDVDVLKSYIQEVSAYVASVFEILQQEALLRILDYDLSEKLGTPIAVYDKRIVCLSLETGSISLGDMIAMHNDTPNDPMRFSKVLRLEVSKTPQATIVGGPGVQFGMEVSFRASDDREYHLIPTALVAILES